MVVKFYEMFIGLPQKGARYPVKLKSLWNVIKQIYGAVVWSFPFKRFFFLLFCILIAYCLAERFNNINWNKRELNAAFFFLHIKPPSIACPVYVYIQKLISFIDFPCEQTNKQKNIYILEIKVKVVHKWFRISKCYF